MIQMWRWKNQCEKKGEKDGLEKHNYMNILMYSDHDRFPKATTRFNYNV
jgi:hypothetical protein